MKQKMMVLVVLVVALFLVLPKAAEWETDNTDLNSEKMEYIEQIELKDGKEYADIYRTALLRFEELNKPMDIVFLGDSLTAYGEWQHLSNELKIVNMGIEGDTIRGVELRIDQVVKLKPKVVFLLVGINDISNMGGDFNSDFYTEYQNLIDSLTEALPNTEIYIQSILPIRDDMRNCVGNDVIVSINEKIKLMAEAKGLVYIDVFTALLDIKDNRLKLKYQID
ncbi:MAG: GDSL-type esterase/lipase family protein, partial [Oscillospiraceae bacterium]